MYRRSKFLEVLIAVRQEMAREADFDTDLFAEMVRSGRPTSVAGHSIGSYRAESKHDPTKRRGRTGSKKKKK